MVVYLCFCYFYCFVIFQWITKETPRYFYEIDLLMIYEPCYWPYHRWLIHRTHSKDSIQWDNTKMATWSKSRWESCSCFLSTHQSYIFILFTQSYNFKLFEFPKCTTYEQKKNCSIFSHFPFSSICSHYDLFWEPFQPYRQQFARYPKSILQQYQKTSKNSKNPKSHLRESSTSLRKCKPSSRRYTHNARPRTNLILPSIIDSFWESRDVVHERNPIQPSLRIQL